MSDNLDRQVTGPTLALAAKVKEALEKEDLAVYTDYGTFYVAWVELRYFHEGEGEILGYLTPDEAEGKTYDFWTPKSFDLPK